jgi:hypothetical protein
LGGQVGHCLGVDGFHLFVSEHSGEGRLEAHGCGVGARTGASGPVFEPRCTQHKVVQPSSSRTSGKVLPGTTVRASMLIPLFVQ